jgi:hypothetical protein
MLSEWAAFFIVFYFKLIVQLINYKTSCKTEKSVVCLLE